MKGWAFIVAVSLAIVGCGGKAEDTSTAAKPAAPPAVACDAWPAVRPAPPPAPSLGGVSCTWSKDDGLASVPGATMSVASAVWASSPEDVYVAFDPPISGASGQVARFDGTSWHLERQPASASHVSLWGTAAGAPWAAGVSDDGRPVLFHRVSGQWQTVATGDGARLFQLFLTGADDDHLLLVASGPGPVHAYRYCGGTLVETAIGAQPVDVAGVRGVFAIDSRPLAYGDGIDTTAKKLMAIVETFDGAALESSTMPEWLSGITAVSGRSPDDLIVAAGDSRAPRTLRIFHVTDGMKTWTPLSSPPALTYLYLGAPLGGSVLGVGCDRTDFSRPTPVDCARIVRFDATSVMEGDAIDPTGGWPEAVTSDVAHGDLHVVLGDNDALRHYRAHCE